MAFFLVGVVFNGFDLALVLVATKTLAQPFFCLLPQMSDLLLQQRRLTGGHAQSHWRAWIGKIVHIDPIVRCWRIGGNTMEQAADNGVFS